MLVEQWGAAHHNHLVLLHPFVLGELSLGNLTQRSHILPALANLPTATLAREEEVLHVIEQHPLHGMGIGYVDAHLLVSARLSHAQLWTLDKRLNEAAHSMRVRYYPTRH